MHLHLAVLLLVVCLTDAQTCRRASCSRTSRCGRGYGRCGKSSECQQYLYCERGCCRCPPPNFLFTCGTHNCKCAEGQGYCAHTGQCAMGLQCRKSNSGHKDRKFCCAPNKCNSSRCRCGFGISGCWSDDQCHDNLKCKIETQGEKGVCCRSNPGTYKQQCSAKCPCRSGYACKDNVCQLEFSRVPGDGYCRGNGEQYDCRWRRYATYTECRDACSAAQGCVGFALSSSSKKYCYNYFENGNTPTGTYKIGTWNTYLYTKPTAMGVPNGVSGAEGVKCYKKNYYQAMFVGFNGEAVEQAEMNDVAQLKMNMQVDTLARLLKRMFEQK